MELIAYRPPHHDELLYGWIRVLAEENYPLDSVSEQKIVDALFPFGKLPERRGLITKEPVRKDFPRGLDHSIREMQASGFTVPNTDVILSSNTPLIAAGIAQTCGDQARYIHTAVSDVTGGLLDMPTLPLALSDIQFCPRCMKENPYIRIWHNLPGVQACAIHGMELGKLGKYTELSNWRQDQLFDIEANPTDIEFAQYAKIIYDNPSPATFQDIRAYMAGHGIKIPGIKRADKCLPFEKTIEMLMEHEVDYKDIVRVLRHDQKGWDESIRLLSELGPIGIFQCKRCGHIWTDAIETVHFGLGCPVCLKCENPDDVINRILSQIGDGNYHLTEPFRGMGATQTVLHTTCGLGHSARLSDRIWHRTTCQCEKAHTVQSMQKLVDRVSTGFTVKAYTPTKGLMSLQHNTCGASQDVLWITFKSNPTCQFCRPDNKYHTLYERLGDDYAIIDISKDGMASVRHKACNQITNATYSAFLRGKKCPLCTPFLTKKREKGLVTYESKLLQEMQQWFEHHPLWVSQRHLDGKIPRKYRRALEVLTRKGYIYNVEYGMYSDHPNWTVYELVKWKYLINNDGNLVGRFTGDTAAYLSGAVKEEPEEITLESALMSPQTHSSARILGRTIRLTGA